MKTCWVIISITHLAATVVVGAAFPTNLDQGFFFVWWAILHSSAIVENSLSSL